MPIGRRQSRAPISLRRALGWLTALVLVVLIGGGVTVVVTGSQSGEAADRSAAVTRAQLHISTLEAAAIDQETALRGYLLSGNRVFLQPWRQATEDWPRLFGAVVDDARMYDNPTNASTDAQAVGVLHQRWLRTVALPEIAQAPVDLRGAQRAEANGAGKRLVDEIRVRLGALTRQATTARDVALQREQRRHDAVLWASVGFAGALGIVLLAVALITRLLVIRPLRQLGRAARRVAQGDRDAPVLIDHPAEIAEVAADVEAMRGELVTQIRDQEHLVAGLTQQSPAVAKLRTMLSPAIPDDLPGLGITGRSMAGEGVLAGDWFDVLRLGDERFAITMGDVAGHGTTAAVTALAVKHALAGALLAGQTPEAALVAANYIFTAPATYGDLEPPALASTFVAVLDLAADTMRYANAGHPAAIFWFDDVELPRELSATGPVLCELAGPGSWTSRQHPLPLGSTMALYSDGLTEASPAGTRDDYGEDRLTRLLSRLLASHPDRKPGRASGADRAEQARLLTAVYTEVIDHARDIVDDATLLLLRRVPQDPDSPLPASVDLDTTPAPHLSPQVSGGGAARPDGMSSGA